MSGNGWALEIVRGRESGRVYALGRGETVLVSETSLGAYDHSYLAGPYLGSVAKQVFEAMSGS